MVFELLHQMKTRMLVAAVRESLRAALNSFRGHLLRTILSLVGITIGVLCIIGILAVVNSLEAYLRGAISKMGENVIYIQKLPWITGGEFRWWEYQNRPTLGYREMHLLQKRYPKAEAIAYFQWITDNTVKVKDRYAEEVTLMAVTHDYRLTTDVPVGEGRYFTEWESQRGEPKTILGVELAQQLFPAGNAVGEQVQALGRKLVVVGVLQPQGNNPFMGGNLDRQALIPLQFARSFVELDQGMFANYPIVVKGAADQDIDEMEAEVEGIMRSIRKLPPKEESNFALNRMTLLTTTFDQLFGVLTLVGWIIAGFSILVGGFGIANIMFVTVRERTPIIGIQKALGATKTFVLLQFLGESVLLCIAGGLIGMGIVALAIAIISQTMDVPLVMTATNIATGLLLSTGIGVVAGLIPAFQAANLDPIAAIRSGG